MPIQISEHAQARMIERGATLAEVEETIELGAAPEVLPNGRTRFRKSFDYCCEYGGKYVRLKHIQVLAVFEHPDWVVITVIVNYSV